MGRVVHPHIITPDSALGGMDIRRSVRCGNGGAFTRTPSVTGNQKVWTWSAWVKKWAQGGTSHLFNSTGSNDGIAAIYFNSDKIHTYFDTSGSNPYGEVTARYYRDPTSWMHIVWQVDALNQTQTIWVNGEDQSTASSRNPPNYAYSMNQSGKLQGLGISSYGGSHTNGTYLAEIHHSDGYKYDPSYYGYTEPQTGIWRPKKVTGISYGTNGFYLDFSDNSTAAALGKDRSGNGNDWTPNGSISVANDKTNDSLLDTPTNNFCTLNPVRKQTDLCHFDQGNLQASGSSTSYPGAVGTIALSSGKWYYEFRIDTYSTPGNDPMCGICRNSYFSGGAGRIVYRAGGHYITSTPSEPSDPDAFTVGDIIGVAIDLDDAAGKIRFYKNGSLQPILANGDLDDVKSDLSISSLGGVYPYVQMYTNDVCTVNFGQRPFSYTPPSGHKKLIVNTNNNSLDYSTPSILDPKKHFDTLLYTTGSSNGTFTHTGIGFKADLMWIKCRSDGEHHYWVDSVRGDQAVTDKFLRSSDQSAEGSTGLNGTTWTSINGGFKVTELSIDNSNGGGEVYYASRNYAAWCWKAGGSSNTFNVDGKGYASTSAAGITDGSIALTGASVNREAGFSIVSYSGTGSAGTIGHGLGKVPKWIVTKRRSGTEDWKVYHSNIDGGKFKKLNNGSQAQTSNTDVYPDTAPTSSVYSLGNHVSVNGSGDTYIAYCWAEIPGYSKFGEYLGNNSADGTYVHLGFKPAWIMVKLISGDNWYMSDVKRDPFNVHDHRLFADTNAAEGAIGQEHVDFLSDGFKFRRAKTPFNSNLGKHIYMAFAEQPGGVTPYRTSPNAR